MRFGVICQPPPYTSLEGVRCFDSISLEVMRFTILDVDNNFDGFCNEIVRRVNTKLGINVYQ
jgi:hypothetical protein